MFQMYKILLNPDYALELRYKKNIETIFYNLEILHLYQLKF